LAASEIAAHAAEFGQPYITALLALDPNAVTPFSGVPQGRVYAKFAEKLVPVGRRQKGISKPAPR